jgi:CheY-like chemotaxis protein
VAKKYLALVVEDDPDLSTIFASALESAGFEVEVINDGGKALARLVDVVPHLVILDLHLPHLSGANALRQIHADRRLIETRVVICTADAAMASELGKQADLVLLKPVMYSQMRDLAIRLVPGVQGPGSTPPEGTPNPGANDGSEASKPSSSEDKPADAPKSQPAEDKPDSPKTDPPAS